MVRRPDKESIEGRPLRPESLTMSYGYEPRLSQGAVKCPIFQTSTFVFESAEEGKAFFEVAYGLRERRPHERLGLIYSRLNNPDLEILEDRLSVWEDAESCAVFESGMAAIATTMLEFLEPGDVILHSEPIYGGTHYLFRHVLTRFGIHPVSFEASAPANVMEEALEDSGKTGRLALIYVETPANPTNDLVDIDACAELARRHSNDGRRVLVAVDNTFLGPIFQQPLRHGADLSLYSATKYIAGHSDVIAGVCLGSESLIKRVRTMRTFLGTMADPWTGWLLLRSLETLKLRMTCQMKNARHVANFLAGHPAVKKIYYPGHLKEGTDQSRIYRQQCVAAGGMISFDINGGEREAFRFLNALRLFKLAVSLGGTESLAEHPASMTHSDVSPEQRRWFGITESMVRLSIGVENPEDLIHDLEQALKEVT